MDRFGNPTDVTTHTSQAVCLGGGGDDDGFAGGFKYLLERSGGGDVVFIGASTDDCDYQDWLLHDTDHLGFPKVNSVTRIAIENHNDANNPEVEKAIRNSEMVFFCGGDQSLYEDNFKDSRLLSAVRYVMNEKKVPVGGTSAGMAYLAGIDFAAHYSPPGGGNVESEDVLKDPMARYVDLERSGLVAPYLNQVITDTHFSQRDRQGRLMGFMARAVANGYPDIRYDNIKAIAADEATAVCYDSTGVARVFGEGNAFFLKGNKPIERVGNQGTGRFGKNPCAQSNAPKEIVDLRAVSGVLGGNPVSLDWYGNREAVTTYLIHGSEDGNGSFDLKSWTGSGGSSEYWYVDGAAPGIPRFGRISPIPIRTKKPIDKNNAPY